MTWSIFIRKQLGDLKFDHCIKNWTHHYLISVIDVQNKSADQLYNFITGLEYQPTHPIGKREASDIAGGSAAMMVKYVNSAFRMVHPTCLGQNSDLRFFIF